MMKNQRQNVSMRNSIIIMLGASLMLIACGQQNQKETNMNLPTT